MHLTHLNPTDVHLACMDVFCLYMHGPSPVYACRMAATAVWVLAPLGCCLHHGLCIIVFAHGNTPTTCFPHVTAPLEGELNGMPAALLPACCLLPPCVPFSCLPACLCSASLRVAPACCTLHCLPCCPACPAALLALPRCCSACRLPAYCLAALPRCFAACVLPCYPIQPCCFPACLLAALLSCLPPASLLLLRLLCLPVCPGQRHMPPLGLPCGSAAPHKVGGFCRKEGEAKNACLVCLHARITLFEVVAMFHGIGSIWCIHRLYWLDEVVAHEQSLLTDCVILLGTASTRLLSLSCT